MANIKLWFHEMRKIFLSTGKGWTGLAPMDAEVDDHVFLLEGGRVPYILRQINETQNKYRIIGDPNVHGIMDGEAWGDGKGLDDVILV